MVEASRQFHWVTVDRDRTPEIPERLNVHAYPSLLLLGDGDENVARTQGFCTKEEFLARLRDGLHRWTLYRQGKRWDEPEPRPERLVPDAKVEVKTIPAPTDGVPGGMVGFGDRLLVLQDGRVRRVLPGTGEVEDSFPLEGSIADLATDGSVLYALPFGWTAGEPILVLDPKTGKKAREIVTGENRKNRAHGAKGIAWHDGRLLVLEGMEGRIHEVDPETGKVKATLRTPLRWVSGLASDGERLLTVGRDRVHWVDPATGGEVSNLPVNYPLRSVASHGGRTWVMEQPVFGFGRRHERIQVWPEPGKTVIYRIR